MGMMEQGGAGDGAGAGGAGIGDGASGNRGTGKGGIIIDEVDVSCMVTEHFCRIFPFPDPLPEAPGRTSLAGAATAGAATTGRPLDGMVGEEGGKGEEGRAGGDGDGDSDGDGDEEEEDDEDENRDGEKEDGEEEEEGGGDDGGCPHCDSLTAHFWPDSSLGDSALKEILDASLQNMPYHCRAAPQQQTSEAAERAAERGAERGAAKGGGGAPPRGRKTTPGNARRERGDRQVNPYDLFRR